jgi:hypothetical protein
MSKYYEAVQCSVFTTFLFHPVFQDQILSQNLVLKYTQSRL